MPNIRKLSPDEIQQMNKKFKSHRRVVVEEYDVVIQQYDAGDYGMAHLAGDENRVTIRNRLRAAAGRRGLHVEFQRTNNNTIRFRVVEPNGNGALSRQSSKNGRG